MVAKTLLVVAIFAVVILTAYAVPAPFFWYGDYSDESSSEEDEKIHRVYVFLNVTDFHSGQTGTLTPGTNVIPINIPVGTTGEETGAGTGTADVTPLNVPIKVTFTVGEAESGSPTTQN